MSERTAWNRCKFTGPRALPTSSRRDILAGLPAALLAACLSPARAAPAAETRIVALGGAVTEILYALGAGGRIVAVDTTSLFPPEAMRDKPNVGYLRALSAEGILSARPTRVIAAEGAGPPDVLRLVEEAGVPILRIAEPPTPDGVTDKIRAVGRAVGAEREAERLVEEVRAGFAALAAERGGIARPPRVLFVLSLQNGRAMVGGRNSTADGILALAGATNAAAAVEGFKPMTDEALIAAAPDALVMMQNGPAPPDPAQVFAQGALSQTPAARERRLVTMDGLTLLGFGPRTPQAARDLMRALSPGAARP